MQHTHPELRVEIRQLGNRYLAVTKDAGDREILSHEFQHETTGLTYLGPLWLVDQERLGPEDRQRLSHAFRVGDNMAQVKSQGLRLYRYLFGNGRALSDYLKAHQDQERAALALTLEQSAASLWRLPWEYLFDGKRFLSLESDIAISRRPVGLGPRALTPDAGPLRILAVIASPDDQPGFSVDDTLGTLQDALGDLIAVGALELETLCEPTSLSLLESLQQRRYQVVHYIGHGSYHLSAHQGFLCLEDEVGRGELVSGSQLPRFLEGAPPRLLVLSACPSAQVGILDAFQSVATELLQSDVAGVLSIPASLSSASATVFYQALYGQLAHGATLINSLHAGRRALKHADERLSEDRRIFDWGVPALYQRSADLQAVRGLAEAAREKAPEAAGAAEAPTALLAGRARELRGTRVALREGATVFYLRGSAGVGKSALMSRILAQAGPKPAATLVIRCRELSEPLAALASIARLWRSEASGANAQAADLLLDSQRDPFDRAREAQRLIAKKRFYVLFDGIDAWFRVSPEAPDVTTVDNPIVRKALLGLLSEPARSVYFFTGDRPWTDLRALDTGHRREIPIALLPLRPAIQVMNTCPELRLLSMQEKRAVHWHIGGHPRAFRLLGGLLSFGESLPEILGASPVSDRSTEAWITHLAAEILDRLDPGEFEALKVVAFLTTAFSAGDLSKLARITSEHAAPLAQRWRHLGLIERVPGDPDEPSYVINSAVQALIFAPLSHPEVEALHQQVARYYGAPFMDAARRQILARNITSWSEERIAWLARDANGILGLWLRRGDEGERAPGGRALKEQSDTPFVGLQGEALMRRALAWQYHLAQSGQLEAAAQIVQAVVPELNRLGQRELAKDLLQRSIVRSNDPRRATETGNLGTLGLEQGSLTEALGVYEEIYNALDPEAAGIQRAHVLMRTGGVHMQLGNHSNAIQSFKRALELARRAGDREGQAECLYKLATAHRQAGNLQQALVFSQAAKEHYEALGYPYGLAAVEREQGQVLKELGRLESALARFAAGLQICRTLGDQQCIADSLTEIGLLFEQLGRTETAIQVLEEALDHYEYLRGPEHGKVLSLLGQLYVRKQHLDEAVAKFRTAKRASRTNK